MEGNKVQEDDTYIIPGPDVDEILPKETIGRHVHTRLLSAPNDSIAMIDAHTSETVTHKQLLQNSVNLAVALKHYGYYGQDKVLAISSENSLNFYVPVMASLFNGSIMAPINHVYTPYELEHTMNIGSPKVVFCSNAVAQKFVDLAIQKLSYIEKIIILEKNILDPKLKIPGLVQTMDQFIQGVLKGRDIDVRKFEPVDGDSSKMAALILCSSGTTGLPKGVTLSHLNLRVRSEHSRDARYYRISDNKNILGLLPFFHAYGLSVALSAISNHNTVISIKQFDPDIFLKSIQDYKISTLALAPPLAVFLAKSDKVKNYDLSSVTNMYCGAAPLSKSTEEELKRRVNCDTMRQGYGLTETTLGVLLPDLSAVKAGSCGQVVRNMWCKVRDPETGKSLGPHQAGELCWKGPLVMIGYYKNEQATRDTFTSDGWLKTGDLAYYDEEGHFYVIDRMKELIKYKGFQVAPAELEAVLINHPKIEDVGVVGLPDELVGERPVAFVVKKKGVNITEKEIQKYVADLLSPQKRLSGGVIFVESIPKLQSGKILRRELRELLKRNMEGNKVQEDDTYIIHGPDIEKPLPTETIGRDVYNGLLSATEDSIAMIDAYTNEKVTHQNLLQNSVNLAVALKHHGYYGQDTVLAISSENCLNFFVPVIASLFNGSIMAPINHVYTPYELEHTMNISSPKVVFCSNAVAQKFVDLALQKLSYIEKIIILEKDILDPKLKRAGLVQTIDQFIQGALKGRDVNVREFEPVDGDNSKMAALILCSSGTTGLPKGVTLSHLNMRVRSEHSRDARYFRSSHEENILGLLPFFHSYGMSVGISSLSNLNTLISIKQFDEDVFLKAIQDFKISTLALAPPLAVFLAKTDKIKNYDLSSVTNIYCGAAPLSKNIEEELKRRMNCYTMRQGYGLTETTLAVLIAELDAIKTGSCGKVIKNMSCKVRDPETGRSLGPHQTGELCWKGPLVMIGYYKNEQSTKDTFTSDGWLKSGDLGYYDEEGYFFVIDRMKELIKYKGFQVAPAELEAVLINHPKIEDVGVVGLPDELVGERPLAFVVKKKGVAITEKEIQKHVADIMSPQKRLSGGVIFVESIPKLQSGKILRRELRELLKRYKKTVTESKL